MEKLEKSLEIFLQQAGLKKKIKEQEYIDIWPKIVGKHIFKYTMPYSLKDKKLWVKVADSVWLYHLTFLKEKLVADFNKEASFHVIENIVFVNAEMEEIEEKKANVSPGCFSEKEKLNTSVVLPEEEKKIEKIIQDSPSVYQDKLKSLMQRWSSKQTKRNEEGDNKCIICNKPFFDFELKKGVCYLCLQQLYEWEKLLKKLLRRTPWISYSELKKDLPSLDEKIYIYCKKKMIQKYSNLITKIMQKKFVKDNVWNRILQKLAQRCVMMKKEKQPFQVQDEDIISALNDFPGLYELVFRK